MTGVLYALTYQEWKTGDGGIGALQDGFDFDDGQLVSALARQDQGRLN
jgi:hypothetical protein